MTTDWRSAAAWAAEAKALGIDQVVMPHTKRGVQGKVDRESWLFRDRQGRGGGREYPLSALPQAFQNALINRDLMTAPVPAHRHAQGVSAAKLDKAVLAIAAGAGATGLADWQFQARNARLGLLSEVDRLMARYGLTAGRAIERMVETAVSRTLSPELAALVPVANKRNGGEAGSRTLSRRTLYRWHSLRRTQGPEALAPKAPVAKAKDPVAKRWEEEWHGAFLRLYRRPQKPSVPFCLEELAKVVTPPAGLSLPSLGQVRRYVDGLSEIDIHRGRMGPRDLKRIRAHRARDVSELWPGCVYSADGHTFDAEVAHPHHGQPFRPEITSVIDAHTRRLVGWSVAIAETTTGVCDALARSFTTAGLCDIFYVDRGKGFNNRTFDDEVAGILAWLGILKENSLPYSSQARGIIERLHKSVWVRAAKRLPTYIGADMDREASQLAHKVTRGELKKVGGSGPIRLLPSWDAFIELCEAEAAAYNARPHSSLPKVLGEDKKMRHMTPDEVWASAVGVHGAPETLSESEALAAFLPREKRVTRRGMVSLWSNDYYAKGLDAYDGHDVLVAYHAKSGGAVWVFAMDGRFLAKADFEGNKSAYFPVTKESIDQRKRTEGRLRRAMVHVDEIKAEEGPHLVIDHQPVEVLSPEVISVAEAQFARLERRDGPAEPVPPAAAPVTGDGERPVFFDDTSWAMWVIGHLDQVSAEERRDLARKLRDRNFRLLLELQGLDVGALSAFAA